MARIWAEPFSGQSGPPIEYWGATTRRPANVLMVSVASFTFHFFSVVQIRDCLDYHGQKLHASSRVPVAAADHWEVHRWFERLPMYLLEEPKRVKVVKALERALTVAESEDVFAP
jgi:hypothetical protein